MEKSQEPVRGEEDDKRAGDVRRRHEKETQGGGSRAGVRGGGTTWRHKNEKWGGDTRRNEET